MVSYLHQWTWEFWSAVSVVWLSLPVDVAAAPPESCPLTPLPTVGVNWSRWGTPGRGWSGVPHSTPGTVGVTQRGSRLEPQSYSSWWTSLCILYWRTVSVMWQIWRTWLVESHITNTRRVYWEVFRAQQKADHNFFDGTYKTSLELLP